MRIPKQIRILNTVYKIRFDEKLIDSPVVGEIQYDKHLIRLHPELKSAPPYELLQTIWHEVVHAYCHESGMNQFLSDQAKEMMCESLSRMIISLTDGKIKP